FGAVLLSVLWIAPSGIVGAIARLLPQRREAEEVGAPASAGEISSFLSSGDRPELVVADIGIAFGGIRAAEGVSLTAAPGRVTSVIGPNGAGKTTVLNMIGGFYQPDSGSVRLADVELAGKSATRVSRAGIARTYQTTKLFPSLSVLDNVLVAMLRGRLGNPVGALAGREQTAIARGLL